MDRPCDYLCFYYFLFVIIIGQLYEPGSSYFFIAVDECGVHELSHVQVSLGETIAIVRAQCHLHSIVHVEPFRVMIHAFSLNGDLESE